MLLVSVRTNPVFEFTMSFVIPVYLYAIHLSTTLPTSIFYFPISLYVLSLRGIYVEVEVMRVSLSRVLDTSSIWYVYLKFGQIPLFMSKHSF
jgi:hypothetical protein